MSKKEVREAEKLATIWNKDGAPADVKLK